MFMASSYEAAPLLRDRVETLLRQLDLHCNTDKGTRARSGIHCENPMRTRRGRLP
jgi:hypothetical protein